MRARALLSLSVLLLSAALPVGAQTPSQEVRGPDPASIVGAPRGERLSGAALDARTAEVASLLRCPVCQGLSVADSPASMALNMRDHVRELLAQGFDQEQILSYFEQSYGEFVRLRPPLRGLNWLVWIAPLLALATGAWWVRRTLKRASAVETIREPPPTSPSVEHDDGLAPYVRRVREQAYGWPHGVKPSREERADV